MVMVQYYSFRKSYKYDYMQYQNNYQVTTMMFAATNHKTTLHRHSSNSRWLDLATACMNKLGIAYACMIL